MRANALSRRFDYKNDNKFDTELVFEGSKEEFRYKAQIWVDAV